MARTGEVLERPIDPDVKLGWVIEGKKLKQTIAVYDINLVGFNIYGSQLKTVEEAETRLFDRQTLVKCYHFLTDDHRLDLPLNACRGVVLGEIIRIWYEVSGIEVPAQVTINQEVRMAKAKETTAAAEAAAAENGAAPTTKEPRITNRSIIENGLLAGKSDEEILAAVKAQFPNGKADSKHIGYYRHYLVKDKKLEKQERKPRAKKEKAAVAEVVAEPAKVAATAGSAKAAAAPAAKTAGKAPAAKQVAGKR